MTSSSKIKVVAIWVVTVVITALLVTLLCIRINNNKSFENYRDLEKSNLLIKDITGKSDESYYVFIYSSKDEYDAYKKQELEPVITRYATYVRRTEEATPLYLYDTSKFRKSEEYSSCQKYLESKNSNLDISATPLLVLVTDGTVTSVYSAVGGSNGIESILVNLMKKPNTEK